VARNKVVIGRQSPGMVRHAFVSRTGATYQTGFEIAAQLRDVAA